MRFNHRVTSAACLVALSGGAARGGVEGLDRVASGLAAPIFVTHAPGDANRLFIAQRGGQIRVLDLTTGALQATPFLSMSGIDTEGEGGFLGMAFHPNYFNEGTSGFGKFYVNITTDGAPLTTRVREFQVSATDPNLANPGSLREILSFAQPQNNHNGGWIGFSPQDNYLYIASGDGGAGNDSGTGHTAGTGNAQDITNNLLGKMLRIDVNGDAFPTDSARNYALPPTNPFVGVTGDDEIWSYGLRNPFRAGFDRQTGDLWIGDVGQSQREEIDFQPANSAGGENYGWRLREGLIQTPTVGGPKPADNVDPVYDYDRNADQFGGTVVTGGYVYRGSDPSLQGKYFFLDSRNTAETGDDNYWMFDPANPFGTVANIDASMLPNVGLTQFPVSFGEDAMGNLYIAYIASGEVYRIRTTVGAQLLASWNVNNSGNWSPGTNWTAGAAPNGIGQTAIFGPAIDANRTVTVDAPRTVGMMTFNNGAASYTIAGDSAITMDVSSGAAAINVNAGSHTISAPLELNDDLMLNVIPAGSTLAVTRDLTATGRTITKTGAGTAQFRSANVQGLTIQAGSVQVIPSGARALSSRVSALDISDGARLDLTDNKLIVNGGDVGSFSGGSYSGLTGMIARAYNFGAWDGDGIRTSMPDAQADTGLTTVAIATADETFYAGGTFGGVSVASGDVLLMYTYAGDLNLDGLIDAADYGIIDNWVQFPGTSGYANGDINFDGVIDAADYGIIDNSIQLQGDPFPINAAATAGDVTLVPEPAGLLMIAATSAMSLSRRRRRASAPS